MQDEGNRLYRVKAVAEMLDVSPATIYRAVECGALEAVRLGMGKGAVRIAKEAIAAYLKTCRQAAVTTSRLAVAQAGDDADSVSKAA